MHLQKLSSSPPARPITEYANSEIDKFEETGARAPIIRRNLKKMKKRVRIQNGRGCPKGVELPLLVKHGVRVLWKISDLDLVALADKYWVDGWSHEKIARYFGVQPGTVRRKIVQIRNTAKRNKSESKTSRGCKRPE